MLDCLSIQLTLCKQLRADSRIKAVLLVLVQAINPSYSCLLVCYFLFEELSCLWFCLFLCFCFVLPVLFWVLVFHFY